MNLSESFKLGMDLFWSIVTAEPILTISLLLFTGGSLLLAFIVRFLRELKLRKSGIYDIDKMSGRKFEEYLKVLLKDMGYSVQLTPASGDYGADLVLTTKGTKIIVQAKRYKNKVGIKAVQEIAAAKKYYNSDDCWVITNRYFTEPAKKLARTNNVRLVDRDQLVKWMLKKNTVN